MRPARSRSRPVTHTIHLRCMVSDYAEHGLRKGSVVTNWRFLCRMTWRHISPGDMILIACRRGQPAVLSARLGDFSLIIT